MSQKSVELSEQDGAQYLESIDRLKIRIVCAKVILENEAHEFEMYKKEALASDSRALPLMEENVKKLQCKA